MNTDLTFTGSTDTDFGTVTMSLATDGTFLGDSGADHTYSLATDVGTITIGNAGDSANAVDDITPTAFEEANGSGSGTYSTDFGSGMDGSMSLKYANGDILGTGISISYSYYPELDGATNNEKAASDSASITSYVAESAQSVNVGIPMSSVPFIGDTVLGGMKITLGYEDATNTVADTPDKQGGATVAVNLPVGPLSIGYQKKAYQALGASLSETTKAFYKDDIIGVAYAVNDAFAISYNNYTSAKHLHTTGEVEQETKAINLAYTVGGLTIGFQDARTDNDAYTTDSSDDTRTISLKTAF